MMRYPCKRWCRCIVAHFFVAFAHGLSQAPRCHAQHVGVTAPDCGSSQDVVALVAELERGADTNVQRSTTDTIVTYTVLRLADDVLVLRSGIQIGRHAASCEETARVAATLIALDRGLATPDPEPTDTVSIDPTTATTTARSAHASDAMVPSAPSAPSAPSVATTPATVTPTPSRAEHDWLLDAPSFRVGAAGVVISEAASLGAGLQASVGWQALELRLNIAFALPLMPRAVVLDDYRVAIESWFRLTHGLRFGAGIGSTIFGVQRAAHPTFEVRVLVGLDVSVAQGTFLFVEIGAAGRLVRPVFVQGPADTGTETFLVELRLGASYEVP